MLRFVALGTFRGRPARQVPWDAARETDSAMGSPEGDAFSPETVALDVFCGRLVHGMSRGTSRETDSAMGRPEGDAFGPETFALGMSRGSACALAGAWVEYPQHDG